MQSEYETPELLQGGESCREQQEQQTKKAESGGFGASWLSSHGRVKGGTAVFVICHGLTMHYTEFATHPRIRRAGQPLDDRRLGRRWGLGGRPDREAHRRRESKSGSLAGLGYRLPEGLPCLSMSPTSPKSTRRVELSRQYLFQLRYEADANRGWPRAGSVKTAAA